MVPTLNKMAGAVKFSACRSPGVVRVISGDGLGDFRGLESEVLLIDLALLIDDEGHHTRVAPFGRPGDEGKSGNHAVVDDAIILAARCVFSLACQDFEIVAVIRGLLVV